jgi:hypothetical protein
LLHHFKNNQSHPHHNATPAGQGESAAPNGGTSVSAEKAKGAKPQPDIQLAQAIGILEHWSKYKVELAKADDSLAAGGTSQ